jgi:indolepyruvate ferredoxin oxidoreductase beta subunit
MKEYLDIYLTGVGGQGILTIADFICQAAQAKDINVSYYPTKGMSQRGGFVKAQIRLGRPDCGPAIPVLSADLAISMERSEGLKALRYLKPEGEFVLYGGVWLPTDAMLKKAPYPEADEVKEAIKKCCAKLVYADYQDLPEYQGAKVRENLFALGLAMGGSALGEFLGVDYIEELIANKWPKVKDANLAAYKGGVAAAKA